MYMVPPFLAYYGVVTENSSAITEAYNQCKLYRNYLYDESAGGMWKHIALGTGTDSGHWSTGGSESDSHVFAVFLTDGAGNGWAAAGMLRVLATMKNSKYSSDFKDEQSDLSDWVLEIQDGMYNHIVSHVSRQKFRCY